MALFQRIKSSPAGTGEHRALDLQASRSAGNALREQRETLGFELADVAAALKIKPAYLSALEEGRADLLPGTVYAVGFVRSYSTFLGLDSDEILRRLKMGTSSFDAKPDLMFPMPLPERSLPGRGAVVAGLILAVSAYAAWYHWSTAERVRPERVAEVPPTLLQQQAQPLQSSVAPSPMGRASPAATNSVQPTDPKSELAPDQAHASGRAPNGKISTVSNSKVVDTPASPVATAVIDFAPAISPAAPPAPSSAPPALPIAVGSTASSTMATASGQGAPASVSAQGASASVPATTLAATATSSPAPSMATSATEALAAPSLLGHAGSIYGASAGSSRISLRANADTWIQVRGADRALLFTGLLKPGDTYRVPDQAGLSLRVGNAGGIDIVVDGKSGPSLGPAGAVRTVTLDPQALMPGDHRQN